MSWTSLCELSELKEGEGKYVEIGGFQLAVFLSQGTPYVMDNTCPHAGGSMAAGYVQNGCAHCPWHHWGFSLADGKMPGAPGVALTNYPTRVLERENLPALVQADLPIY